MIPSREQLVEAYAFYARRKKLDVLLLTRGLGRDVAARSEAIDAALKLAAEVVDQGHGEATAVIYAFGSHPRCFPGALLAFTTLVAKQVAQSNGQRLAASTEAFRSVIMGVAQNASTLDDVAEWVELHTAEI